LSTPSRQRRFAACRRYNWHAGIQSVGENGTDLRVHPKFSQFSQIWEAHPNSKPSFIAYNDACDLLCHIITQNPDDPWLTSTKFIVDAWHYIGHRATDIFCRLWCNPAPKNGSQPDLILGEQDVNCVNHQTWAFNTETAEQLNSWLNGFESQLRHV
jgi:hypothetical protein